MVTARSQPNRARATRTQQKSIKLAYNNHVYAFSIRLPGCGSCSGVVRD